MNYVVWALLALFRTHSSLSGSSLPEVVRNSPGFTPDRIHEPIVASCCQSSSAVYAPPRRLIRAIISRFAPCRNVTERRNSPIRTFLYGLFCNGSPFRRVAPRRLDYVVEFFEDTVLLFFREVSQVGLGVRRKFPRPSITHCLSRTVRGPRLHSSSVPYGYPLRQRGVR